MLYTDSKSHNRHSIWEILHLEMGPIPAIQLLEQLEEDVISIHQLKRDIAEHKRKSIPFLTCQICKQPLYYRLASANQPSCLAHFAPSGQNRNELQQALIACPFYHKDLHGLPGQIYNGEGKWHFENKHAIANFLQNDPFVRPGTIRVEPYLYDKDQRLNTHRRPDIFFESVAGDHFAIELTRWWMNYETVVAREQFMQANGYHLIWLFSPSCPTKNRSTFEYIMFGNRKRKQHNTFGLTESSWLLSNETGHLHLTVYTPEYELGSIEHPNPWIRDYQQSNAALESLILSDSFALPYAIDTFTEYSKLKAKGDEHRQQYDNNRQQYWFYRIQGLLREHKGDTVQSQSELIQQLEELTSEFTVIRNEKVYRKVLELWNSVRVSQTNKLALLMSDENASLPSTRTNSVSNNRTEDNPSTKRAKEFIQQYQVDVLQRNKYNRERDDIAFMKLFREVESEIPPSLLKQVLVLYGDVCVHSDYPSLYDSLIDLENRRFKERPYKNDIDRLVKIRNIQSDSPLEQAKREYLNSVLVFFASKVETEIRSESRFKNNRSERLHKFLKLGEYLSKQDIEGLPESFIDNINEAIEEFKKLN